MIVLDTNVLSEVTSDQPHQQVASWVNSQPSRTLFLSSITAAEVLLGIALLPEGRKRETLTVRTERVLNRGFRNKILPFDLPAARAYATLLASRTRMGRMMPAADAQIAAICHVNGAQLATRNTKDFLDTGIELINPWEQG